MALEGACVQSWFLAQAWSTSPDEQVMHTLSVFKDGAFEWRVKEKDAMDGEIVPQDSF